MLEHEPGLVETPRWLCYVQRVSTLCSAPSWPKQPSLNWASLDHQVCLSIVLAGSSGKLLVGGFHSTILRKWEKQNEHRSGNKTILFSFLKDRVSSV